MHTLIIKLLAAGITLGIIAGNSDEIIKFFNDTETVAQQIATAGDMRSISTMLDYEFIRRGRYPRTEHFERWMGEKFKENDLKPLTQDHWGYELVYRATKDQKKYTLISLGPDGIEGTEDDIRITGP
ncbi:MAG: type II secretion system protein GspG [Deltaproteobacteria bacterium]|nr:type II secretion system protein GspG [Deltaproteobacteria bacterium]MBW2020510.1 type II secretion system protein GspG [Deltaproteobacteria bacterium]MBW2075455.1 type II secretion system protein GspG [Deltaproteobacteria bacterium]RLB83462.1 MAG: general secretion pathway protein GspG [Deltaproteobacteria bacterium]